MLSNVQCVNSRKSQSNLFILPPLISNNSGYTDKYEKVTTTHTRAVKKNTQQEFRHLVRGDGKLKNIYFYIGLAGHIKDGCQGFEYKKVKMIPSFYQGNIQKSLNDENIVHSSKDTYIESWYYVDDDMFISFYQNDSPELLQALVEDKKSKNITPETIDFVERNPLFRKNIKIVFNVTGADFMTKWTKEIHHSRIQLNKNILLSADINSDFNIISIDPTMEHHEKTKNDFNKVNYEMARVCEMSYISNCAKFNDRLGQYNTKNGYIKQNDYDLNNANIEYFDLINDVTDFEPLEKTRFKRLKLLKRKKDVYDILSKNNYHMPILLYMDRNKAQFVDNILFWNYDLSNTPLTAEFQFKEMLLNKENVYSPFFKNPSPIIPFSYKVPISFDEYNTKINSIDCYDERLTPSSNIREFHTPHMNGKGEILKDGSFDIHLICTRNPKTYIFDPRLQITNKIDNTGKILPTHNKWEFIIPSIIICAFFIVLMILWLIRSLVLRERHTAKKYRVQQKTKKVWGDIFRRDIRRKAKNEPPMPRLHEKSIWGTDPLFIKNWKERKHKIDRKHEWIKKHYADYNEDLSDEEDYWNEQFKHPEEKIIQERIDKREEERILKEEEQAELEAERLAAELDDEINSNFDFDVNYENMDLNELEKLDLGDGRQKSDFEKIKDWFKSK